MTATVLHTSNCATHATTVQKVSSTPTISSDGEMIQSNAMRITQAKKKYAEGDTRRRLIVKKGVAMVMTSTSSS